MKNERIKLRFQSIGDMVVSSVRKGETTNAFGRSGHHYQYRVTISTKYGKMSFTFTDSEFAWQKGIDKLDKEALFNALDCLLSDIAMYLNDGFDGCYRDNSAVVNGCRREWEHFKKVIGDNQFWDVNGEFENMYEYYNENGFVGIDKTEE